MNDISNDISHGRYIRAAEHRRTGRGGEGGRAGGAAAPPVLSGNFYLRLGIIGQSSCSCFVSLIFLIFSFHLSLAPCIKTHTKTQEMAF